MSAELIKTRADGCVEVKSAVHPAAKETNLARTKVLTLVLEFHLQWQFLIEKFPIAFYHH